MVGFEKTITNFTNFYFDKIVEKYKDNPDKLSNSSLKRLLTKTLLDFSTNNLKLSLSGNAPEKVDIEDIEEEDSNDDPKKRGRKKSKYTCNYIYKRGNKGQCTTGVKKGQQYCKRHINQLEDQEARTLNKESGTIKTNKSKIRKPLPFATDISRNEDEILAKQFMKRIIHGHDGSDSDEN